MTKLRAALEASGVPYRILQHETTVNSARDGADRGFGALGQMAPTLILRTEAGYLAAILCGNTRLSYRKIKQHLGLRNVSLASPEQVIEITGAAVGTVSMVNPGMRTLVDRRILEQPVVFGGCGAPHFSLEMDGASLVSVTRAEVFDFAEEREP